MAIALKDVIRYYDEYMVQKDAPRLNATAFLFEAWLEKDFKSAIEELEALRASTGIGKVSTCPNITSVIAFKTDDNLLFDTLAQAEKYCSEVKRITYLKKLMSDLWYTGISDEQVVDALIGDENIQIGGL